MNIIKLRLNLLNGWERIGLIAYAIWIGYWLFEALSYPPSESAIWYIKYSFSEKPTSHFLWVNFIVLIISPYLVWNLKTIFLSVLAWVKKGFNQTKQ